MTVNIMSVITILRTDRTVLRVVAPFGPYQKPLMIIIIISVIMMMMMRTYPTVVRVMSPHQKESRKDQEPAGLS